MHVVVLGAGVIGITTAYYLSMQGHKVTVLDRQPVVGQEASFANAGMVTVGYASPWSAPGLPLKALKWAFRADSPMLFKPQLDPAMAAWIWQWWRHCAQSRYVENKSRMIRLAAYSLKCLSELREKTGIQYDQRQRGTLHLFRTDEQRSTAEKDLPMLRGFGVDFELLDANACVEHEPGLTASDQRITGGLKLPIDESGDCLKFTQAVARLAALQGVNFHFGATAQRLLHDGSRIVSVETNDGKIAGDAFVMALGAYSTRLLRPLGIPIPVYPLKGYSLTIPIVDESRAPSSVLLDESSKVAITRMGNRIRAGGIAELTGFDTSLPDSRRSTIARVVKTLFPGAGDVDAADFRCGLRAVTPDGPPVLGETRYNNLYLNTGHGSFGWTMACGSGRILADLISGAHPAIDMNGLTIKRYR